MFLAANEPQGPQDSDELTCLLDYVARGTVRGSAVEHLDRRVREVLRNDNWRYEFMYYSAHDQDKIAEGKGLGEQKLGSLMVALLEAGRTDDAKLAASNISARKRLYEELGIIDGDDE